jgi:ABC-2 type transport system permease protein
MPIYYGCSALKNVILKGYGISQVWDYLLALLVFIFFLSVINTFALKKYREI